MKRNLTIGFTIIIIVIISISCIAFGSPLRNDNEKGKDTLLSLEEYEKEYGKSDTIVHLSEGEITDEDYFGDGSLIVKGKLKDIRGVIFSVGESPCIVYELEVTDTIVNSTGKEHKIVNFVIPEMIIPRLEDKLQMDQESLFYLTLYDEPFPHLKEEYYDLISITRGIVNFSENSEDKESYKQLKKNLTERKKDFDKKNKKNKKNR
ncbi:hypothetical protein A7W90_02525 [Clostridium sp. Bc-iso-3]|nr:hypothetical protein A7W90_02525 [Clostridium sp. Bc-iso-3]